MLIKTTLFYLFIFRICLGTSGSCQMNSYPCRLSGGCRQGLVAFMNTTVALRPPSTPSKLVTVDMSWAKDLLSSHLLKGTAKPPYLLLETLTAVCGRRAGPAWDKAKCRATREWGIGCCGDKTELWNRMKKRKRGGMTCMCVEWDTKEANVKWLSEELCPWTFEKNKAWHSKSCL